MFSRNQKIAIAVVVVVAVVVIGTIIGVVIYKKYASPSGGTMTYDSSTGLWTGSFTVVSTGGATYWLNDGDNVVVQQYVGGATPTTGVTWNTTVPAPLPNDMLFPGDNAVTTQTQALPSSFTTLTINQVATGDSYITYA